MKRYCHILVLCAAINFPAFQENAAANYLTEQTYNFEKLLDKNSRSLGFITGISQCENNFLWISTGDGLYRYDGYSFVQFKKERNDSSSTLLTDISYLYVKNSSIWIRHFDQLGLFENEKVSLRVPCISDSLYLFNTKIVCDGDNNYWVGPTPYGIIRYSDDFKTSKVFRCAPGEENTTFNDLIVSRKGDVSVIYQSGISRFNKEKQEFEYYYADWKKIARREIPSGHLMFINDSANSYWIGTDAGLIRYNVLTKQCLVLKNEGKENPLTSNNITCLFTDKSNTLWVGTDNGITLIRNGIVTGRVQSNSENGLFSNYISTIYQDKSGNMWIGTSEGLNKLIKSIFSECPVNCSTEGELKYCSELDNLIWYIGEKDKLIRQNYLTGEMKSFRISIPGVSSKTTDIGPEWNDIIAGKDYVWLYSENKVIGFNKTTQQSERYIRLSAIVSGRDSICNKIFSLIEDIHGKIWIISLDGITMYNPGSNQKAKFIPVNNIPVQLYNIDMNYIKGAVSDSLGNIYVRTTKAVLQLNTETEKIKTVISFNYSTEQCVENGNIVIDASGNIWFASLPDFFRFFPAENRLEKYSFDSDFELSYCNILPDTSDIWIYTNNGLYRFNLVSGRYASYFYSDGIPDNTINGLFIDSRHNLWVSTDKGLSCFKTSDYSLMNNYKWLNENNSFSFKIISNNASTLSNDLLLFAGDKLLYKNTDSINNCPPKIVITRIGVLGNSLIMDSLSYQKKLLRLKYNENLLSFTFSALDFTAPGENSYAYKLENTDKAWHYTDASERTVNYAGLSPGRYVFNVKACNSDEVWNELGERLIIIISPPWYKTKGAFAGYGIIILLIFLLIVKIRERRLKQEKKILEQKVIKRTQTISKQNKEIIAQRDKIVQQNKDITDSILYAKQIQAALLPPDQSFEKYFSDFMVLYRPRDIVSGDFYWLSEKNGEVILIVADCTGHGVPGAFMSMLGISTLTDIIGKMERVTASEILEQLRDKIILLLHQSDELTSSKDGMDISVCVFNKETYTLQFSGAYNSLYLFRDNELCEIKADRQPIGYYSTQKPFANNVLSISKGDVFYLLSDGYVDQFHFESNEKFKIRRLKEILHNLYPLPLGDQKESLLEIITEWIGTGEQIDDITIVGVRI